VLPTGEDIRFNDLKQLRYSDTSKTGERIERAYAASRDYLAGIGTA